MRWAAELLDVAPDDEILEIGCGPGVAVSLVCPLLEGGRITAVDRSATAIRRTAERNAEHLGAGRLVLEHGDLATLALPRGRFDKVFAVNVNVFWVRPAGPEARIVHDLLRPGGVLRLVYGAPDPQQAERVAAAVAEGLAGAGFTTSTTSGPLELVCVTGFVPG